MVLAPAIPGHVVGPESNDNRAGVQRKNTAGIVRHFFRLGLLGLLQSILPTRTPQARQRPPHFSRCTSYSRSLVSSKTGLAASESLRSENLEAANDILRSDIRNDKEKR